MLLRQLFDPATSTYTYLIADASSRAAALVDPVREHLERDHQLLRELGLELEYVLETHVHADHVTSAGPLADLTGAQTVIAQDGAACGHIRVRHGDRLSLGALTIEVLETPGHTNDSLSFRVGGHVFTGDCLLVRGTGRADFQNGDPHALYDSITQVLFALPDATIVWPGHDYRGHTCSTIGEERRHNPRVAGRSREEFVAILNDLNLPPPRHIEEAVPANRACGRTTSP
jgi:glyoxylase-like metal-dependent hydrolase (beta-lactamase superfamily II)